MKQLLLSVIALMATVNLIAQDDDLTDSQKRMETFATINKHEVSLDITAILAIPAFSPRYEYILGRYSGVGADLFISLEDDDLDFSDYEKFSLTPYYRQYFFSKEDYGAKGFYAEGFVKFYTFDGVKINEGPGGSTSTEETAFETAIGAGIGWKWVSDSGFLVDLGIGVGRNLGFVNDDLFRDVIEVQIRGGLNFGWRF